MKVCKHFKIPTIATVVGCVVSSGCSVVENTQSHQMKNIDNYSPVRSAELRSRPKQTSPVSSTKPNSQLPSSIKWVPDPQFEGMKISCYGGPESNTYKGVNLYTDQLANTAPFDPLKTVSIAANRKPLGTKVKITYKREKRGTYQILGINDAGPYDPDKAINGTLEPHPTRAFDISDALRKQLGIQTKCSDTMLLIGKNVTVEFLAK